MTWHSWTRVSLSLSVFLSLSLYHRDEIRSVSEDWIEGQSQDHLAEPTGTYLDPIQGCQPLQGLNEGRRNCLPVDGREGENVFLWMGGKEIVCLLLFPHSGMSHELI